MGILSTPLSWLGYQPIEKKFRAIEAIDQHGPAFVDIFPSTGVGKFTPYFFWKSNPTVQAALNVIANAAAHVPVKVFSDASQDTEIDTPELISFMQKPNKHQDMPAYLRSLVHSLELDGNCFEEWANDEDGLQVYNLISNRMDLIRNKRGNRLFRYTVNGNHVFYRIDDTEEEIVHGMYEDPGQDFWGFSPLQSAIKDLIPDSRARDYNDAFLKNGCRPSLAITLPGEVDESLFTRFQRMINKKLKGEKSAGNHVILTNGATVQELSQSLRDIEYLGQRKWSREQTLGAVGVPPVMVGIFEFANYANAKEQMRIFWGG